MKRLILGSALAVALAVGLTVGPSIATPEQAPKAEAQVAQNAVYIFYGPWLCEKVTKRYQYPTQVFGPDVSPPGLVGNKVWHLGNAVRVSPVILNVQSQISATIRCPGPWWAPWYETQANVVGVRVFRRSGESHWMNTNEVSAGFR